jgi:tetratricopeptide (TPR) repeat protein
LGLLLFVFFLGPTLGLIRFQFQCHAFIADHFAYFACIGFFIAVASWVKFPSIPALRAGGALVLAMLATATWGQSRLFSDPERLWRTNVEVNPSSWGTHLNLADVLLKAGLTHAAHDEASKALELEPSAAIGYGIVGTTAAQLGNLRDAERAFRNALRLRPENPQFHHNLANVLARQGRFREAIDEYESAAARAPEFALTYYLMGDAYQRLGMIFRAKEALRRALEIDPEFESAKKALNSLDLRQADQLK